MSNPTSDKFHRLIRRNKGSTGPSTSSIISNGKEIASPDTQRKVLPSITRTYPFQRKKTMTQHFLNCVMLDINSLNSYVKKVNQTLNQLLRMKC